MPAILTNDISDFRKKYAELFALSHYFTKLHIDFVDGEFLPNKTVMPKDLIFLKTNTVLMAHFMTLNPHIYFATAKKVGFSWVIFHYEAFGSDNGILSTIEHARRLDLKIGLAINPETALHDIAKYISKVDLVQIMGIHPGAQGRAFIKTNLDKISELKKLTKNVIISVDGGVKLGLVSECVKAGADWIVEGSAIWKSSHPKESLEALVREAELK